MVKNLNIDTSKKSIRAFYLIIVLFAFALYGNTITNYYSLDDDFVIYKNERVQKGIRGIPEQFATHYSIGEGKTYGYRPITRSFFSIEYDLFGSNPHISHLINIFLYAFTGIFLFNILRRFLKKHTVFIPFFIVLFFMAHPVHTEVVASLKNREELFSFLGGLGSLWCFYKFTEKNNWRYIIPGVLLFIIGYLSKENVLVFAALIPLTLYFFTTTKIRNIIIFFLILIIVGWLVKKIIDRNFPSDKVMSFWENPLYLYKDLSSRIVLGANALLKYLTVLIFPNKLLFYYGYDTVELSGWKDYKVFLSLIIHFTLFVYAIVQLRKKSIIAYGILFYLISISMFANIYVPVAGIVGERLVYIGSLGFSVALVFFIFKIFNRREKEIKLKTSITVILLFVIILFSLKTIVRNKSWKDTLTLLSDDIEYLDNSARANVLYAGFLMSEVRDSDQQYDDIQKREMLSLAVTHYKKGLRIYDKYPNAYKNLGNIYFTYYKDYQNAKINYLKALEIDSVNTEILLNLGYTFEAEKAIEKAEKCYKEVLKIDKENIKSMSLLANLYFKEGDLQKAIIWNDKIVVIDTSTDIPYINMGNYYLQESDTAKAVSCWEKAVERVPDNIQLLNGLYRYFEQINEPAKSEYYKNLYEKYRVI